ncbi:hypothetical protein [Chitinilyticum piscinae]|nr:hypothetical protein [Chitinilyticum piscinae]
MQRSNSPSSFLAVEQEKAASANDKAVLIANKDRLNALRERRRDFTEREEIERQSREVWQI